MTAAITAELLKHSRLKPGNDSVAEFTVRVLDKINKLADTNPSSWEELSEEAQEWVNRNVTAQTLAVRFGAFEAKHGRPPNEPERNDIYREGDLVAEEDIPAWEESGVTLALLSLSMPDDSATGVSAGSTEEEESTVTEATTEMATPARVRRTAAKANGKTAAAKPAKETKVKETKVKETKAKSDKRGRGPLFTGDAVIKVLVTKNPWREGGLRDQAYKKLKSGMTVSQALKAGVPRGQLLLQRSRKVISIRA